MADRAVLFADVAGSTSLYEILGDKRAFALIEQCLDTMSRCTAELHGRVIKTIGDAVNLASRLCDLASRGQIITDGESAQRLSTLFAGNLRRLYGIQVKGREKEVDLIEIVWQSATEMDVGPDRRKVTFAATAPT